MVIDIHVSGHLSVYHKIIPESCLPSQQKVIASLPALLRLSVFIKILIVLKEIITNAVKILIRAVIKHFI